MTTRRSRKPASGAVTNVATNAAGNSSTSAARPKASRRDFVLAAALFVVTLIAYFPALRGGMLWDDDGHVTKPVLRSMHGLWRIWFDLGATQQYYPLLHSAFWAEHGMWGDAVLGYHAANVVLHGVASLLLVAIMRRLALPGAWLAGFIFALHPVCVEAVAWISEQKSTLSAVLYLASALVYLHFDETRKRSQYLWALLLFVMALTAKSVTATLPSALLVVFWWKRGKIDWKRDVLPLAPWIAVGAAAGLFTAWVERTYIGAQGPDFALGLVARFLLAGRVICFYVSKLLLPVNLMFFYPHWLIDTGLWWQYLFPAGVLAAAALLLWLTKKNRGPLAAFLFFAGTLFPVLGFFNVYPFVYSYTADHFTYLASLGIIVPAAVLASRYVPAGAGAIAVLGILTWRESRSYRDVETLYRDTLARNPASWISHNNLGNVLLQKPVRLDEAVAHFKASLQLKPNSAEAYNNLGTAYSKIPGREGEALAQWEKSLELRPNFPLALNNLGSALSKMPDRRREGIDDLQKAISLKPDYADAHNNLGAALSKLPGRTPDAIAEYELALQLDPGSAEAHNNLAIALAQVPGRTTDVIAEYEAALKANPDSAEAHSNLGSALTETGRLPEALDHLQTALRLNPKSADAHADLGVAYSKMPGRMADAIAEYQKALQLDPNQPNAHNDLGIALEQAGKTNEAIPHFEAALRYEPDSVETRMNLGIALIDVPGRLPEAVTQFETAAQMKPDLFAAHYMLGLALLRTPGRHEEGLSQIEAALKIKPDPDAQRIVDQMRQLRR